MSHGKPRNRPCRRIKLPDPDIGAMPPERYLKLPNVIAARGLLAGAQ